MKARKSDLLFWRPIMRVEHALLTARLTIPKCKHGRVYHSECGGQQWS